MPYDDALAQRVRERMDFPETVEKPMFGGLAFLTGATMTVGVMGDDLLARVGPDAYDAALERLGVREFDFTGRPMRGWVMIAGEHLDDPELDSWVGQARAFVATLPPK